MYWLESERLLLRRWQMADLDDFCRLTSDAEVMRWVGDGTTLDRAGTAGWIERANANVARWGFGTHAVLKRDDRSVIGWAGLIHSEQASAADSAEIIYALRPDCWGRGYATELAAALLAWAWQRSALVRIVATIDPANTASLALMTKLGFSHEGDGLDEDGLPESRFAIHRPVSLAG